MSDILKNVSQEKEEEELNLSDDEEEINLSDDEEKMDKNTAVTTIQSVFRGFLVTKEKYKKQQLKSDLKEIKKKTGLLDDPSNYLDIGTVYYLNNKKMENLTDYSKSLEKRNRYRKTIVPISENEYTNTFDKLNDDKNEAYDGLPTDKKQLIAKYMMKCKLDEMGKIEKILYPFLDNN
eukprot:gene13035-7922_t